jgi:thiamine biosynthesis lipoprotein
LVDLWHAAAEANSIPSDAALSEARSKVGYEKLILDANQMTARFAVDGMRIDLGGIAKGYAVDRAVEAMLNCGATGGLVDIGGNIRCFGQPSGGKKFWLVGLQNPNDISDFRFPISDFPAGTGMPLLVLQLTDAAVATSGGYRRFALIGGKKYSHIIDPSTGISAENLLSVTIISRTAIDADALSTVVSVLGAEKGLALIKTIPQTEAILITPQNKIIKTSGAEKYIK